MTSAGEIRVRFSDAEQLELAEYRPFNRVALIACLLGLVSSAALIHPLLYVLPVLGIISAILALRQLHAEDNQQSGRNLALIGLFLSVLFGSWGAARASSRDLRLYGQARQFAENWFATVRDGRLYEAHQLTLKEATRVTSGESLEKHYSHPAHDEQDKSHSHNHAGHDAEDERQRMMEVMEPAPHETFEAYFREPFVKRLRDLGSNANYKFRENVHILSIGLNSEQVELVFEVSESGSSKSFPVLIALQRDFDVGVADWNVTKVVDYNAK